MALLAWSESTLAPAEIAQLCRRAENLYVGSPCGIMDQFVVTAAVAGFALLLNTRDLSYELLPMRSGALANTQIVVFNSGVKHSVATGEYGVRRREVEAGQAAVCARHTATRDLGDTTLAQLESCRDGMSPESFLRCRHIVTENERVRHAAIAMKAGDAVELGRLLSEAHISFRDDFAASCEEIDFLVDTALNTAGCFGARMTGGGFGGCTVNLVATDHVDAFIASLHTAYEQRFHRRGDAFVCEPADGAVAMANKETHA